MSETQLAFSRMIKTARKSRHLRQIDLAEATGMSRPSIANIELGRQSVNFEQVICLLEALGITSLNVKAFGNGCSRQRNRD